MVVAIALAVVLVIVVASLFWLTGRRIDGLRAELRKMQAAAEKTDTTLQNLQRNVGAVTRKVGTLEAEQPPDVAALVEQVKESVFTVQAGGIQGTGFVIRSGAPEGYQSGVLTNAHVVQSAIQNRGVAIYLTQGKKRLKARLWDVDMSRDLALLYVKEFYTPLPWLSEVKHPLQVGDFVMALGSPYGLEGSTTTGVVSKIAKEFIQTDAAVNPGNSGGPLLNRYGEVVGIVSFTLSTAQNINFAVPIELTCKSLFDC